MNAVEKSFGQKDKGLKFMNTEVEDFKSKVTRMKEKLNV